MSEGLKVGIVYRDEAPKIFNNLTPQSIPWSLVLLSEKTLRKGSVVPSCDYLAVFFPSDDSGMPQLVSKAFPDAERIAYRISARGSASNAARRNDGLLTVQFPADFPLVRHLIDGYAITRSERQELSRVRHRANQMRDFLDAFTSMIESSWEANERKLAMSIVVNRLLAHIQAEGCIIYLHSDDAGKLQRVFSTGNFKDIDHFEYEANTKIVEKVLATGMPYASDDHSLELKAPLSQESLRIRSLLCIPLERRGEKIGVLEILNKRDGEFSEEDQSMVQMVVDPLAVAMRTVDLFENAERLTITDDLTKLYNYRYLMRFLEAEVKRCLRYKKKVSLLFIDIDGFKRINDTFGHLVGSQALAELGQVLRRSLRETDVVGRYGGDEFVVVLPETPVNGAMVIAERIRKKVEDYEFFSKNVSIRLTVSLGVANCPKHTLTAEGLIKKADAAMYRAKELTKNSIKVAV